MSNRSITLLELLISIVIVSIMVLIIYNFSTYSQNQVIYSDRRAKVQNDLNYALEHMSKYVQLANGNVNQPGIELFPPGSPTGFRVRVDLNQTPWNLGDDSWVRYNLDSSNTITVICAGVPGCTNNEELSKRILNNFVSGSMPGNPTSGFYVLIGDQGSSVEIGLVARYNISAPSAPTTNPQVGMKSRIICNSCSTN